MSVILTVALQDRFAQGTGGSDTGLGGTGADLPLAVRDLMTERLHAHLLVGDGADHPGPDRRVPAAAPQAGARRGRGSGRPDAAPVLMHA